MTTDPEIPDWLVTTWMVATPIMLVLPAAAWLLHLRLLWFVGGGIGGSLLLISFLVTPRPFFGGPRRESGRRR